MSVKSKNSSRKKAIDRPFDPKLWKQAAEIARGYRIVIEFEDDEYFGCTVEMPYVMADGKTPASCVKNTLEATTLAIATMLENDEQPPAASSDNKRHEQVNVRLTAMEKMRLEEASRRQGFRGLSDYIRNKALEGA